MENIKTVNVTTLDEQELYKAFGDNLTIYTLDDYENEKEEYRDDDNALILNAPEGKLLVLDDTGQGVDYLTTTLKEYGLLSNKATYDVKIFTDEEEDKMRDFMNEGKLIDVKVLQMGKFREYNVPINAKMMIIIERD